MTRLEEERRRMAGSIARTWAINLVLGAVAAYGYYRASESPERMFQSVIVFAFLGVTLSMMTTLIRLSLRGYYLGVEAMEKQARLLELLEGAAGEGKLEETLEAIRALPERLERLEGKGPGDLMGKL